MSQYSSQHFKSTNQDAPFPAWNPQHNRLTIGYSNNFIHVWFPIYFDNPPSVDVRDITGSSDPDHKRKRIHNSLRHGHIVGEYDYDSRSIIIRHRKRIYEITLPPHARKISCGENKLFIS